MKTPGEWAAEIVSAGGLGPTAISRIIGDIIHAERERAVQIVEYYFLYRHGVEACLRELRGEE